MSTNVLYLQSRVYCKFFFIVLNKTPTNDTSILPPLKYPETDITTGALLLNPQALQPTHSYQNSQHTHSRTLNLVVMLKKYEQGSVRKTRREFYQPHLPPTPMIVICTLRGSHVGNQQIFVIYIVIDSERGHCYEHFKKNYDEN